MKMSRSPGYTSFGSSWGNQMLTEVAVPEFVTFLSQKLDELNPLWDYLESWGMFVEADAVGDCIAAIHSYLEDWDSEAEVAAEELNGEGGGFQSHIESFGTDNYDFDRILYQSVKRFHDIVRDPCFHTDEDRKLACRSVLIIPWMAAAYDFLPLDIDLEAMQGHLARLKRRLDRKSTAALLQLNSGQGNHAVRRVRRALAVASTDTLLSLKSDTRMPKYLPIPGAENWPPRPKTPTWSTEV